MERTVLAVDIGTSSLKAALVDARGTVVASARVRFPETQRVARDWMVALDEAARSLKTALCASAGGAGHAADKPAAIVISGNGPTLVSVHDQDIAFATSSAFAGDAGPVLMWNDPVGADAAASEPSGESIFIPRLSAYKRKFSDHWDRARYILSGPEYLIYALTGNAVTILPERRYENAYWTAESLSSAGLDGAKLAPFVTTGAIVGTVARGWADFAFRGGDGFASLEPDGFLSAGIPVIAGGPDFIVALVGTGTMVAGTACDRAGTSEGLNVCTAARVAHGGIRTLPAVAAGLWNASYLLPETGAAFHAWRLGTGQNARAYPEIMAEIEASPIFPARGEPLHAGRAMVERIGFSVRRGIETLERATGFKPTYVLSGGQARNEIWNQMKADITGAPFALTATPDGELMGDAVIGFAALGDYKTPQEAAARMVRITRRYEPDGERHAQYTEKYLINENT